MCIKNFAGALLYFSFSICTIQAQDPDSNSDHDSLVYRWEKFTINLGGFLITMNSDINLIGRNSGLGVSVNLEDALGLSTSTFVIRGEAEYNFGSRDRSHLRMGYFGLLRNSMKTLESEISIGNQTYPIGTEVRTDYNLHIIRGLYDFSFFRDERVNLAVSAGMYVLPVSFSIGTGQLIDENTKLIAPLPVAGIRTNVLITPRILLKQSVEVLYVRTGNFQGSISDMNIWLEYNPFRHWGLGMGFNTFRFQFAATPMENGTFDLEGSLKTSFTGLLLYGKYFF